MRGAGGTPSLSTGHGTAQSVRRIQRELKEISEDPSRHWTASPVEDDLFEWKFAVRGPPGTDFEGGIYTGRLVLPNNYPLAPPSIMLLTPNGRFEVGKKICLSNSNYHPELWQPAWGIRTMMEALRSHFPVPGESAIGALDYPSDIRKKLAKESLEFICPPNKCKNRELLPELTPEEAREDLPESPLHQQTPSPLEESAEPAPPLLPDPWPKEELETVDAATDGASTEGLRHRGTPISAAPQSPQPAAARSEPTRTVSTIAENASSPVSGVAAQNSTSSLTPASSSEGSTGSRRRAEGARGQRRPQSLLLQLVKPPGSRREWVLLFVDILILLATVCLVLVAIDLARNPPALLNALPDMREGKS